MAKLSVAEREALLLKLLQALKDHAVLMQGRYKIVPANWAELEQNVDALIGEFEGDKEDKDTDAESDEE